MRRHNLWKNSRVLHGKQVVVVKVNFRQLYLPLQNSHFVWPLKKCIVFLCFSRFGLFFFKKLQWKWGKMMQNPMFVGRISRLEDVASIFVGMTVFTKRVSAKKGCFPNLRYEKSCEDILKTPAPPKCNSKTPSKSSLFTAPKRLLEMDHLSGHGWLSEMVGSDRYRQCHLATLYRKHGTR